MDHLRGPVSRKRRHFCFELKDMEMSAFRREKAVGCYELFIVLSIKNDVFE